jgi:arginyl-tRNA synthetase
MDPRFVSNNVLRLQAALDEIIHRVYPSMNTFHCQVTRSTFADYQSNAVLVLNKPLKVVNIKATPLQVFDAITSQVTADDFFYVEPQPNPKAPPFLNIHLQQKYVVESIGNLLINGIKVRPIDARNKVVIDYSSPNIAKEMHVGHLRSTIIGDCIANVLEFIGYEVLRLNHVGDWGTQFGMLLTHLMEQFPNFEQTPPAIGDLQSFYKESKTRFDNDPEFKKRAYERVVKLQSHDPLTLQAWQLICSISRKEFSVIYDSLGIKNLKERGESFYHSLMNEVVKDLKEQNILITEEGRQIAWPSETGGKRSIPLIVVKSDGGFTYDTSDLACIRQRVQEEKADRVIYVTDEGQSGHFDLVFRVAADAKFYDPAEVRVEHVGFGVVLGEDRKKFKTRSGDTVRLKDLLDEGMERALAKLKEKGRDQVLSEEEMSHAQKTVAFGCIKYADLCRDRRHEYEFSFDRMLDDKGNTAVYMLYSLARIRSIIRKAVQVEPLEKIMQHASKLDLTHDRELRLARHILRFSEAIHEVAETLYPHTLCTYLFELAVVFSEFYEVCYCIESSTSEGVTVQTVNHSRVLLAEATARVLTIGLNLLGIQALERM